MTKTAVVLFNLGGPDRLESVQPFLFNLFYDPAIFPFRNPFRYLLAQFVSRRRRKNAQEIYAKLGGGSPLYPNTLAQAQALESALGKDFKVFVAMRYWHPRATSVIKEIQDFQPDQVVLLPLYPQYSTTTSGSSLKEWKTLFKASGMIAKHFEVCCYPEEEGFIQASANLVQEALERVPLPQPYRILFSAHGLPERIVQKGDPYASHVKKTAEAIIKKLHRREIDFQVCYQSRVGPEKWIGPFTPDEIQRAGQEGRAVIIVPLSFVSEHSETLVELDEEYQLLAQKYEVPLYLRVPTVSTHPLFIKGLKNLVFKALEGEQEKAPRCPETCTQCPRRRGIVNCV